MVIGFNQPGGRKPVRSGENLNAPKTHVAVTDHSSRLPTGEHDAIHKAIHLN